MLMLKSTHEAIVAKKDAEIAGLMKRLETADGARRMWLRAHEAVMHQNGSLRARLAVFTAPRKRGLGGRFVSSKGGVA